MKAHLRYQRISPRKVRLAAKGLRGARVDAALDALDRAPSKASELLARAIRSALAGAPSADPAALVVRRLSVDGGPILHRWRAMSMGRAGRIRKRTSHIHVELDAAPAGREVR